MPLLPLVQCKKPCQMSEKSVLSHLQRDWPWCCPHLLGRSSVSLTRQMASDVTSSFWFKILSLCDPQ